MELSKKYLNTVVLKNGRGNFVNAYDDSALLISFLMNYKINNGYRVGFPKSALGKVQTELEKQKVSYVILDNFDKESNYYNLKNLSRFDELLKNARKNKNDIKEIDRIIKLLENSSDETVFKISKEIEKCLM